MKVDELGDFWMNFSDLVCRKTFSIGMWLVTRFKLDTFFFIEKRFKQN